MAETSPRFDPYGILHALDRHRVKYVLIGGFARVLQGTEEITRGIDIVPSTRTDNLDDSTTHCKTLTPTGPRTGARSLRVRHPRTARDRVHDRPRRAKDRPYTGHPRLRRPATGRPARATRPRPAHRGRLDRRPRTNVHRSRHRTRPRARETAPPAHRARARPRQSDRALTVDRGTDVRPIHGCVWPRATAREPILATECSRRCVTPDGERIVFPRTPMGVPSGARLMSLDFSSRASVSMS